MGCVPFHMGLFFGKMPAVESFSHSEGYRGSPAVPADNGHGSFLLLVTSLTRPVSLLRWKVGYGQP